MHFLLLSSALFLANSSSQVSATNDYKVQYLPDDQNINTRQQECNLANAEEAYKYTILAEDFMVQVNLIATGTDNPEQYFADNVAPRIASDMTISAPSVGLELSGPEAALELFLTLADRNFAYHMWDMPRVCRLSDGRMKVYFREFGFVQNDEDGEGGGDIFNVFTAIELAFNENNEVDRLVSTRRNTIVGGELGSPFVQNPRLPNLRSEQWR